MKTSSMFSSKRREALERLLEKKGVVTNQVGIPRWDGDRSRAPLSFSQHRLWLNDQIQPGNAGYNLPSAFYMPGVLDILALENSLNEVARRHESLRTSFQVVDGQPVQVIVPDLKVPLPLIDLQNLSDAEREPTATRLAIEEAQLPFDLATGPLLRCKLLRLGSEEHILLLTIHHIISDGWSNGILAQEALTLYMAFSKGKPSPLPELPIQYVDFAAWQRGWLQGERLKKLQTYWEQCLADMPVLELPSDHLRPEIVSYKGADCSIQFSQAQAEMIKAFSRDTGTSLFMVLLAGFLAVLARYTGQLDITVRSPAANRMRQQTEKLIGYFVNILALRSDISGNPTFDELVHRVSDVCQGAYAHQDLPFEQVLDDFRPVRRGRGPLFPVMFILHNISMTIPDVPDGGFHLLTIENNQALFDLTVNLVEDGSKLYGSFNYSTDLFKATSIQTMIEDFQIVLESAVSDPGQRLDALGEKIPQEHIPPLRQQSLEAWETSGQRGPLVAPRTKTEETLVKIWQDVLGVEQVGIYDNFFELGGDSLLVLRIITLARQAGLYLAPNQFFQSSTVAGLAETVGSVQLIQAEQGMLTGPLPITHAQCWFLDQNFSVPHLWHIASLLEVPADMRPDWIKLVVQSLLEHHDALRSRFTFDGAKWLAYMATSDEPTPFSYLDFSQLPTSEHKAAIEQAAQKLQASLNITTGPLLRVAFFYLGTDRPARLLIVVHHIVIDGNNMGLPHEDFQFAYQQLSRGEPLDLPTKTTSYKQAAEWWAAKAQSDEMRQEESYWLSFPWRHTPLPIDFPNAHSNTEDSTRGVLTSLSIKETRALLQSVPKKYNAQIMDVLLWALARVLTQWNGGEWAQIKVVDGGQTWIREMSSLDLSRTVGLFASDGLVMLKRPESEQPVDGLRSIQEQFQRIPRRGLGYELLLRNCTDPERLRQLQSVSKGELKLNYHGRTETSFADGRGVFQPANESIGPLHDPQDIRDVLLYCDAFALQDRLSIYWFYSEHFHQRATINKVAQDFVQTLRDLIQTLPEARDQHSYIQRY